MNIRQAAADNRTARIARFTGFVVLVAVMMFLAGQVGNISTSAMQQPPTANIFEIQMDILEDSISSHIDRFCYKSCTFIR